MGAGVVAQPVTVAAESDGKPGVGNTLRARHIVCPFDNLKAFLCDDPNEFVAANTLGHPKRGCPEPVGTHLMCLSLSDARGATVTGVER